MAHLTEARVHVHVGEPLLHLIPVDGLTTSTATSATWRALGVETVAKSIGAGITVISGSTAKSTYPDEPDLVGIEDGVAVLVVDVDPADTIALGVGWWRWQARAGGAEPKVVAFGRLTVSRTIDAG